MANRAHVSADHITPLRVYLAVGLTLFVLTAITVMISKIHLGPWNAIVALGIASLKALLVALFFMHLLYDKKIYMIIVSVALVMLAVLIALTMADILRRGDIFDYQTGPIAPNAKIYDPKTGLPLNSGHHTDSSNPADSGDTTSISATPAAGDSIDHDAIRDGAKQHSTEDGPD
jgi:cytochrome c oxidase subunit 4